MKFKTVFFDLDGTLTDPAVGITNSVAYALRHYGIEVTDRTALYPFIGPPLTRSFREFYGFDEKKAQEALMIYREYFSVKGLYENEVYGGIPHLLDALGEQGVTKIVASAKPERFVRKILAHFSLDGSFDFIGGNTMEETRCEKKALISYGFASCPRAERPAAMVGDRSYDILGAKEAGLYAVGVSYGYGSREELEKAGADRICDTVEELTAFLLGETE